MTEPVLRAARAEDAAEIAALLRRSITELCAEDHLGDPAALAGWLANKSPEAVRRWVADPGQRVLVAEIMGRLAGVGSASDDGVVLLNYVSPDFVRRGVGAAILSGLEAWLAARGVAESRLKSTRTAHGFYRARGYRELGAPGPDARPMAKPLAPVPVRSAWSSSTATACWSTASRSPCDSCRDDRRRRRHPRPGDRPRPCCSASRSPRCERFSPATSSSSSPTPRSTRCATASTPRSEAELRPIPGIAGTLDMLRTAFCVASSSQPERIKVALTATRLWPRFRPGLLGDDGRARQACPRPLPFRRANPWGILPPPAWWSRTARPASSRRSPRECGWWPSPGGAMRRAASTGHPSRPCGPKRSSPRCAVFPNWWAVWLETAREVRGLRAATAPHRLGAR